MSESKKAIVLAPYVVQWHHSAAGYPLRAVAASFMLALNRGQLADALFWTAQLVTATSVEEVWKRLVEYCAQCLQMNCPRAALDMSLQREKCAKLPDDDHREMLLMEALQYVVTCTGKDWTPISASLVTSLLTTACLNHFFEKDDDGATVASHPVFLKATADCTAARSNPDVLRVCAWWHRLCTQQAARKVPLRPLPQKGVDWPQLYEKQEWKGMDGELEWLVCGTLMWQIVVWCKTIDSAISAFSWRLLLEVCSKDPALLAALRVDLATYNALHRSDDRLAAWLSALLRVARYPAAVPPTPTEIKFAPVDHQKVVEPSGWESVSWLMFAEKITEKDVAAARKFPLPSQAIHAETEFASHDPSQETTYGLRMWATEVGQGRFRTTFDVDKWPLDEKNKSHPRGIRGTDACSWSKVLRAFEEKPNPYMCVAVAMLPNPPREAITAHENGSWSSWARQKIVPLLEQRFPKLAFALTAAALNAKSNDVPPSKKRKTEDSQNQESPKRVCTDLSKPCFRGIATAGMVNVPAEELPAEAPPAESTAIVRKKRRPKVYVPETPLPEVMKMSELAALADPKLEVAAMPPGMLEDLGIATQCVVLDWPKLNVRLVGRPDSMSKLSKLVWVLGPFRWRNPKERSRLVQHVYVPEELRRKGFFALHPAILMHAGGKEDPQVYAVYNHPGPEPMNRTLNAFYAAAGDSKAEMHERLGLPILPLTSLRMRRLVDLLEKLPRPKRAPDDGEEKKKKKAKPNVDAQEAKRRMPEWVTIQTIMLLVAKATMPHSGGDPQLQDLIAIAGEEGKDGRVCFFDYSAQRTAPSHWDRFVAQIAEFDLVSPDIKPGPAALTTYLRALLHHVLEEKVADREGIRKKFWPVWRVIFVRDPPDRGTLSKLIHCICEADVAHELLTRLAAFGKTLK